MELKDIFSGIGATIIGIIVSAIISGGIGYKIGFRRGRNQQIQKAGDGNVTQMQIGEIHYGDESKQTRG